MKKMKRNVDVRKWVVLLGPYRPVEREKENMSGLKIATLNRNTKVREGQMGLFSHTIKSKKERVREMGRKGPFLLISPPPHSH